MHAPGKNLKEQIHSSRTGDVPVDCECRRLIRPLVTFSPRFVWPWATPDRVLFWANLI